jgi:hypothetical protein
MTRKEYLREVEWRLRDVPWKRRKQVVGELAAHLDETPPEQLDTPQAYAAELRRSENLPRRHGFLAFLRARRPRNLVIVGVLLVLVALIASGFAWAESYQPLAEGNYGLFPIRAVTGPAGETAVTFRDGAPFRFGFSVRNDGSFAVRVVGVPHATVADPFVTRTFVSRSLERARDIPGPTTPFRPFDLEPGEQRMLILRGVFANCRKWGGRMTLTYDSLPVRFRFLWRTETVSVPLADPLVVQIPAGRRCLPGG